MPLKNKTRILLISFALLFVSSQALPAKATIVLPSGRLKGRVTDSQSHKGIEGVTLELLWQGFPYQKTKTDKNGNYSFASVDLCGQSSGLSLAAEKRGWSRTTEDNIAVPCWGTLEDNFSLERVPPWRQNIKPGDILYDKDAIYSDALGIFTIGHTAMYVGDLNRNGQAFHNQEIEALLKTGVTNNNISTWDYPDRNNVYLLRVATSAAAQIALEPKPSIKAIRQGAVSFVRSQLGKPYDWHWWQKDPSPSAPSWYCSELDWAAYWNQGIDLEHHAAAEYKLGESPWVSPAEIFADEDTFVVSSHYDPKWDFFTGIAIIAASPVDIQLKSPSGSIGKNAKDPDLNAYYIEDFQTSSGKTADLIILPEKIEGEYSLKVFPEPGAEPSDTYSLEVYRGEGEGNNLILAHNAAVPAQGESDEYVFSVSSSSSAQEPSQGRFADYASSHRNFLSAASLDFSLQYSRLFAPQLTPSQNSFNSVHLKNTGSLDFAYKVRAENFSGSLCSKILLDDNYTGSAQELENFVSKETLFSQKTDWRFTAEAARQWTATEGEECRFELVFSAWEPGLGLAAGGFRAEKRATFLIRAGAGATLVINELLPNPDPQAGGFDFGKDSDALPKGEWVELYNKGDSQLNLAGWALEDADGHRIEIEPCRSSSSSTRIEARGFLVVYRKGRGSSCTSHNFSLNNSGDTVKLYDSQNQLVDSYSYGSAQNCSLPPTPGAANSAQASGDCSSDAPPNKSYSRIPDGSPNWVDPIPSPDKPNKYKI